MLISFPSKTFLMGEYAVLDDAPAVLVNTAPRFEFQVNFRPLKTCRHPFHKKSLAALWIEKNKELFSNISIQVKDPHQGRGGFGLSSAEFNCAYLMGFKMRLKKENVQEKRHLPAVSSDPLAAANMFQDIQLLDLRRAYRSLSKEQGTAPSGADILSQWVGGLCLFDPRPFSVRSLTWPFWNLSFVLIRTGRSLQTWKYLKSFKRKSFPLLKKWAYQAFQAIEEFQAEKFIKAVNMYSQILDQNNLTAPASKTLLKKFSECKEILAAKGCGAMGAEVIVVFFKTEKRENVLDFLKNQDIVSDSGNMTYGLNIKQDNEEINV